MATRGQAVSDHIPTVASIAVVVYATAIGSHELGHAAATLAVGGDPTMVTSTEMLGEFDGVNDAGIGLIGVAGSLANWTLAVIGLVAFRLGTALSATHRLFWLLMAAVNGFVPALYMATSPLLGFGDWTTILRRLPGGMQPVGILAALVGVALTAVWVGAVTGLLARLLGSIDRDRAKISLRLMRASWATGGGLALVAALFSPLGMWPTLFYATGSTLGTTWPLMVSARLLDARPPPPGAGAWTGIGRSRAWQAAGAITALVFVLGFGRGIRL